MQLPTRPLGHTTRSVSVVGVGGMYLSIQGRPSEPDALRTLHAAFDAGATIVDTADVYCLDHNDIGHNERLIAKALQSWSGPKDTVLVATKGGLERPDGRWTRNARPEALVAACERSLRALGVSQIPLYQLHAPDDTVPFTDSIGALARLQQEGKIQHIGLSNVSVEHIEAARAIVPIVSVQNRWSPFFREVESNGVLAHCTQHNITFLPYSPFGGAQRAKQLTGKTSLSPIAQAHGHSPHQLILAWMLARSPAVVHIPGCRRVESITNSLAAAQIQWNDTLEREFNIALKTF